MACKIFTLGIFWKFIVAFHSPSTRHPRSHIALAPHTPHQSRRRFLISHRRAATRPVVPRHWAWRTQEKTQDEGCGAARPLGECRGERPLQFTAIRSESSLNAPCNSVGDRPWTPRPRRRPRGGHRLRRRLHVYNPLRSSPPTSSNYWFILLVLAVVSILVCLDMITSS